MITDSKGEVIFANVSADKHLVVVKVPGVEKSLFEINVLGVSNQEEKV